MQTAGLPGDFVTSQVGHSSLKITSIYTHFEHRPPLEQVKSGFEIVRALLLYLAASNCSAKDTDRC
jgi:hypothetical protein